MIKDYLNFPRIRKLHVGCGSNVLKGWLNTDLNPSRKIVFLDAKKRLPFNDQTFDYVFSEHLIEHLEYQDGERFLRECHRILKPGGKTRLSTPNLCFLIELYNNDKTGLQERYIRWAVDTFLPNVGIYQDTFVINNFFRNWGHEFIYDSKVLHNMLLKCGFVNITSCKVGESYDENLRVIECHSGCPDEFNKLESMVFEGTKPS
jgi:predicted SAM-dependent methyltransferase